MALLSLGGHGRGTQAEYSLHIPTNKEAWQNAVPGSDLFHVIQKTKKRKCFPFCRSGSQVHTVGICKLQLTAAHFELGLQCAERHICLFSLGRVYDS